MSKFKVGDRVRRIGSDNFDDMLVGDTGTVASVDRDGNCYVRSDKSGEERFNFAQYLKLAPLKIEAGKFYKTRDGRKVGPAFIGGSTATFGTKDNWQSAVWVDNGRASPRNDTTELENDIIAEWVDKPVVAIAPAKSKFKVGDRVRHARIKRCSNGEITGVLPWGRYRVNWRNDLGTCVDPAEILELVTPASAQPTAIVCLIENGQPKPSVNPFVHASAEAAATEAKRLAGKYRGKKFGVYVLQSTEEQAAPSYSHEWQRLAAKGEKISAIKELRALTGMQLKPAKDVVEHFVDYPYGAAA